MGQSEQEIKAEIYDAICAVNHYNRVIAEKEKQLREMAALKVKQENSPDPVINNLPYVRK